MEELYSPPSGRKKPDPAETDEPIEMPFEGPRNRSLDGLHTGVNWRIRLIDLCGGDDAGCCYRYSSYLLLRLK